MALDCDDLFQVSDCPNCDAKEKRCGNEILANLHMLKTNRIVKSDLRIILK